MNARCQVVLFNRFKEHYREMHRKAIVRHSMDDLKSAIYHMISMLERNPSKWGDPLFPTATGGGIVHRAIVQPIIVDYIFFEDRKLVWILDVRPWPGSGLD